MERQTIRNMAVHQFLTQSSRGQRKLTYECGEDSGLCHKGSRSILFEGLLRFGWPVIVIEMQLMMAVADSVEP